MMAAKILYDAIIIGGGPAGLSVALGLGRQTRKCLVISHNVFRNDGIEASHAVLGHDHTHPQEISARARQQIERYGNTSYVDAEIVSARPEEFPQWRNHKGFVVKSKDGQSWSGKTLVLATGVKDILPDLKGYKENWPKNIYQCLFCDGWERRHSQKAVFGDPSAGIFLTAMASMALGLDTEKNRDGSAKVTILTNGPCRADDESLDPAFAKGLKAMLARGVKIDQRKVIALEDADPEEGVYVHLRDESSGAEERLHFGFIVSKPPTTPNAPQLIQELGIELDKGMFGDNIKAAPPFHSTNVPGVFAVGDCGNALTHVTTALATGVSAAGGIVHYLNGMEDADALADIENS
ncbi:hypothetical protein H072_11051 [Dactylellina haptotyla CBS 200.50]|uniref:FAD/NAD(P)-binding domain-containing protein n=1 Tax=Dactylellina haptotyla (strain CBS 200.50) TaxID=1284197 RepID=S7ZXT4_DACHA|nr:hypothetical protein H072_11051 [Dactylellina haptotyla CBS 200.50]